MRPRTFDSCWSAIQRYCVPGSSSRARCISGDPRRRVLTSSRFSPRHCRTGPRQVLAISRRSRSGYQALSCRPDLILDSPKAATAPIRGDRWTAVGVTDSSQADSGDGILPQAYGKLPLPSDPSWSATAYLELYDFSGSSATPSYVQALGGSISTGAGTAWRCRTEALRRLPGKRPLHRAELARSDFVRLYPNPLGAVGVTNDLEYGQFRYLSGSRYVAFTGLHAALTPTQSLRGGISLIRDDAANRRTCSRAPRALRYVQEWSGGWIGSLFARYSTPLRRAGPIFGVPRRTRNSATARRHEPPAPVPGSMPRFTVDRMEHHSNARSMPSIAGTWDWA